MKKIIIALAVAAMAFAAQANVVNGDFSAAGYAGQGSGINTTNAVGMGWYTNNTTSQAINIGGGVASRNDLGPNSLAGIAQLFSLTGENGSRDLKFDLTITDANANLDFYVVIGAYDYLGGGNFQSADYFNIVTTNSPLTGARYDFTQLGTYTHVNLGGTTGTKTISFTASSSYEFYAVSFISNSPDAADSMTLDNVNVVPEPATVGMLGLGALVTLIVRRMKR